MSDLEKTEMDPLHESYKAASLAASKSAAMRILIAHGADFAKGGWRSVPAAKRDACIAALDALAEKPATNAEGDATARGLDRIRKQAFANLGSPQSLGATPPKSLDADAIFQKWNAAKTAAD